MGVLFLGKGFAAGDLAVLLVIPDRLWNVPPGLASLADGREAACKIETVAGRKDAGARQCFRDLQPEWVFLIGAEPRIYPGKEFIAVDEEGAYLHVVVWNEYLI